MTQKKMQKQSKKQTRKQPAKQEARPQTPLYSPQHVTFPPPTRCDQCGQAGWKIYDTKLYDHGSWIERRRFLACANCKRHGVSSQAVE